MLEKGNIFNTESISVIVRQSWPKQLLDRHYHYAIGLKNNCKWSYFLTFELKNKYFLNAEIKDP